MKYLCAIIILMIYNKTPLFSTLCFSMFLSCLFISLCLFIFLFYPKWAPFHPSAMDAVYHFRPVLLTFIAKNFWRVRVREMWARALHTSPVRVVDGFSNFFLHFKVIQQKISIAGLYFHRHSYSNCNAGRNMIFHIVFCVSSSSLLLLLLLLLKPESPQWKI